MAKEKAKEFVEHLLDNPGLVTKMQGFTQEEFGEAVSDLKSEGRIKESDEILPHTL